MKQISHASSGFELVTKRAFLDEMSLVVPGRELVGLIQPFAPRARSSKVAARPFSRDHAAHLLLATVVWLVRSGHGRGLGRVCRPPAAAGVDVSRIRPMKHNTRVHRNSEYCGDLARSFQTSGWHLPTAYAHSSPRTQQMSSGHPRIAQCKKRH
jgi:hypothetical protein